MLRCFPLDYTQPVGETTPSRDITAASHHSLVKFFLNAAEKDPAVLGRVAIAIEEALQSRKQAEMEEHFPSCEFLQQLPLVHEVLHKKIVLEATLVEAVLVDLVEESSSTTTVDLVGESSSTTTTRTPPPTLHNHADAVKRAVDGERAAIERRTSDRITQLLGSR